MSESTPRRASRSHASGQAGSSPAGSSPVGSRSQGKRPPHAGTAAAVVALALVALLAVVVWWTVTADPSAEWVSPLGTLAAWTVFVPAALVARRIPARHAAAVVLLGSFLVGAAAIAAPPATSNDSARYAWDGIVQKAGISPYAHFPADEALRPLRPAWLFQEAGPDGTCHTNPFPTGTETTTNIPGGSTLCTAINRPAVPTVYPAVAELYFLAVRLIPGSEVGFIAFQLAGLILSLAITAALLAFLRRTGRPAHQAMWWAWSPLVAFEAINGAHVDALGAALALAAGLLLVGGRALGSGMVFGAAVATKLIPAINAPALLYRRPVRFVAAAVATFAAAYVPYVLASGWAVLGYLPEYLRSEGYDGQDSPRFTLLKLVLPASWAGPAALVLLLGLALYVWRTTNATRPWDGQVLMVGGTLLIVSPSYPWYALLLIPFVVLSRRYEFTAIAPVLAMMYFTGAEPYGQLIARLGLSAVAVLLVVATVARRRPRQATT
ncbi:glycosyltransferase 87 family protein [Arthrobacter sp. FW306-04-A]|uniref:glycosyltransferase 87 family protein n=1 Tax=Arthrobacter sp. FW306-04-A TaxID=2879619 RepID=UPI0037C04819|nr:glycosyltransferase 87 family protein [Arthrobacter sp. FW306-04-A]